MEQSEKWYMRIWVWWAVLTAVYLAMFFSAKLFSYGSLLISAWNTLTFFIGLFVPFGWFNTLGALWTSTELGSPTLPTAVITAPLLLTVIFLGDRVSREIGVTTLWWKIVFNLIVLITLTFIVDFTIYQKWPSVGLFLQEMGIEESVIPDFFVYDAWK
jgi:hypothetical protein